ncbi:MULTISPECIES: nucleotide exchange factor GrpE [Acidobacterium]|uniref:Protein GrpE n=1 Tax=Acidobacterium capsulatum (strain ATCC 51196 / DSM 11244 / BCRC 80197 / JCM 7670 / NBRC 15755 / NCIMB 13165 / 161) TaxID=240015 RepID=GRPE_ACIC5|nr:MULTISPECIES: nucleotide exchange factor GrpE [Acidobacterium]C1F924.1 RecName: Full=Protein GrpE; AltName: Full=HSP-70 cofactor [Acidobacterium capsulatum ATCC 51196]ACO31724.1 co-chaperone GrpE [Acidobacterium capsulatum ATCC 51196]HCT62147.1 nucleotide exchange factor GrpE [Acidobacterium sp.]
MSRKLHEEELTPEGMDAAQNADPAGDPVSENEGALPAAEPQAQILQEEVERLRAERDAALADREAFQDRLARLQAEFDNARKREAKERSEFRDYSVASTAEAFLPVLDNFQLALASTGTAEQLRMGVELIVKQMDEALRSLSIIPIETVGAQFDPRVHEALEMVEREDVPDHQVIEEVRRGYRIRERLMRPALVRIASNSKQTQA